MKQTLLLSILLLSTTPTIAQTLAERNYPPKNAQVTVESSNLPLVWITVSDTLSRYSRTLGHMKVINNANGVNYADTVSHQNQTVEFDGPISIKWRGASSFGYDGTQTKKPMSVRTLKTEDINSKKDKVSLLGLGKDDDWCFLAPWQDASYIRDILTMEMARGGYVFTPHMKYCEVFFNGIYYGLFILSERATKGSKRLNLWDYGLDADGNSIDDTTGDFHVEIDRPENNFSHEKEPHYTSKYHPVYTDWTEIPNKYITYQYKDPDEEDFAELPGAREALHKAIDDMEDAFYAEDYKEHYADFIDIESFMDYEIAQELCDNMDGYRLSTPMYKYSSTHAQATGDNDKWKMALWDFNLTYITSTADHMNPGRSEWRYTANDILVDDVLDKDELIPFYWQKLMEDETYVNGIRARYTQRRLSNYTKERITSICDSLQQVLDQGAATRDQQAWKRTTLKWKNLITSTKQFIDKRMAWMDERWYDENLLQDLNLEGTTLWKDDSWNTLCLPFRLATLEGTPLEGATIKTLVSSDYKDGTLTLNFTKKNITSISPGKPYIVKWDEGENNENPTFTNVIYSEKTEPIETDYIDFVGTFSPLPLAANDFTTLYLGASNTLYYPVVDVPLNAYHAYFKLKNGLSAGGSQNAPIRSLILNFDGESVESIRTIIPDDSHQTVEDIWYTIDGIRLNGEPSKKGIYIREGKIVSVE
ncbi:MAG: CotH kinase family protein [Bacteroidales bacterium]|nr:CotH kinase family protein [Bacteroidales bacterium]